ncbi:MAG: histone deacetylase [Mariniblastus sp.]
MNVLILLLTFPLILFVAWVVYANLPGPELEVTQVDWQNVNQNENRTNVSAVQTSEQQDDTTAKEAEELPFTVNVVYSPGYLINLGGLERLHPFDIKKYQKIHNALKDDGLLADKTTWRPEPISTEDCLLVHTKEYLKELKSKQNVAKYLEADVLKYAPVSLERGILDPFRRASGGTVLAARTALKTGIGINIGGGYHHAKPNIGEGFCLFADVPIAIRKLQKEKRIKRAVIIDVDVHQGNGTILCLDKDDSTFTFSMHQDDIYPIPKEIGDLDVELKSGMGDEEYLKVLNTHLSKVLDEAKADICFIVGGCDPLKGDPLANLTMSHEGIVKRDQVIIDECVKRKLPVVLTLSGGYSEGAWKAQYLSIKNLIEKYKLNEDVPVSEPAGKKQSKIQEK